MSRLDLALLAVLTLTTFISSSEPAKAHPPVISAVEFGHPVKGNAEAEDTLNPRTTVVGVGATVYFGITSRVHGVAIYDTGTRPSDIDTSILIPGGGNCPAPSSPRYINDTGNRLAVFNPPCSTTTQTGTVSYTFDRPGRYLVICTFDSHFNERDMYGWVWVKEKNN